MPDAVAVLVVLGVPVALWLVWFRVVRRRGAGLQDPAARWTRVQEVFEEALDRPGESVEAFLNEVGSQEPEVAAEVRSLLVAHRDAGPLDMLHDRVAASVTGVSASAEGLEGRTVLQYEVLERLGGGGMGVVYKARDTKLDRFVALKFLPPNKDLSKADEQRFLREAQAASALDHANICTIHEITDSGK